MGAPGSGRRGEESRGATRRYVPDNGEKQIQPWRKQWQDDWDPSEVQVQATVAFGGQQGFRWRLSHAVAA
jgi:hypothetical protein